MGTSALMMEVVYLKDWLAERKMVKQKSENPPVIPAAK
jgi:hypothetical protein